MSVYQRIKDLANERHISISELERTLNFSNGIISKWNKNMPNTKQLIPIANFFDVSTDYLLGRTKERSFNKHDKNINEALDEAMSYDGKPLTDHDRDIMKQLLNVYLENKDK